MLSRQAPLARGPARAAARALSRAAALAGCAAALLAGCGGDEERGQPPGAAATELEIELDPDGQGGAPARSAQLVCDPGAGRSACEALAAIEVEDFEPVAPGTLCTEIYGGPDEVRISGSLRGEPVEAELSRSDGCEIERFERFSALLRSLFDGYRPGEALGAA